MLCLGTSDKVDRDIIKYSPTPVGTSSWQPIAHQTVLGLVEQWLGKNEFDIISECHGLAKDGNRYFGLLEIAKSRKLEGWTYTGGNGGDHASVIGVRNSHDKSFPAGIVCGTGVFVCDNLMFDGEVKFGRKHTVNIKRDLPNLVDQSLGRLSEMQRHQENRIACYKRSEITDTQANDILIESLDAKAICGSQIPKVLEQWRTPNHPEFVVDGKTAWRMYNAFTEVLKGTQMNEHVRRTQRLNVIMDAACTLAI